MIWLKFYNIIIRETLIPLVLMLITPNAVILLPWIVVKRKAELIKTLMEGSIFDLLKEVWSSINLFDLECWTIIAITLIWALLTLLLLPGEKYFGPPTENNFRPKYWNNGFKFYLLSMSILIPFLWHYPCLNLYYKIPDLCGTLTIFGLIFCIVIYFKGLLIPDPGLCDFTGNPIFDFYWGIELYPQFGKYISLKLLINSRFGLWLWQTIILICWKAHYELYQKNYPEGIAVYPIATSTLLQTIYLAKFYYWEDGYMQTIDICVDRFGYMLAWGCIAFVPGYFTLSTLYLVKNSPILSYGAYINLSIFIFGCLSIIGNYWVDYQRQICRKTDGNCLIFGKKPILIRAKYKDQFGVEHNSVLLASGFWSMARHLNYFFELMIALSIGLPALNTSIIPYLYFLFLLVLLIHRTFRDDGKCSKKYGHYWQEYCRIVPYKIIPYIF